MCVWVRVCIVQKIVIELVIECFCVSAMHAPHTLSVSWSWGSGEYEVDVHGWWRRRVRVFLTFHSLPETGSMARACGIGIMARTKHS